MKKLSIIFFATTLLTSCGNNKSSGKEAVSNSDSTATAQKVNGDEENPIVEVSAGQIKAVGIEIDTLQMKELTATVKVNGMLTVPNQNKALVSSVTTGIIKTLLVQPGNSVRKGQLIATIINPDVAQLQQQLQVVNAQLSLAEIEQARQKELVQGDAAPLKSLQRANTELATLNATKNSLQQQLRTMGIAAASVNNGEINTTIRILAPISGTISQVPAQIGSTVDATSPIANIINNDLIHLDIFVYEKDLPKIKQKQTIHFVLTNLPGKEYDAEIYSIGAAFAADTKTVPVHAVVKGNKTGLIDGMNVTAIISTGKSKVAAVPTDAIVTNAGQDFVFVRTSKIPAGEKEHAAGAANKSKDSTYYFERTAVAKGSTDIGFTEIIPLKPLPKDTRIVSKGAFFVLAKMINKGEEE